MENKEQKENIFTEEQPKDDPLSFLEKIGISPEVAMQIIMKIPGVVNDLMRGTIQLALEEKNLQESLKISLQEKKGLLVQIIVSMRSFIITTMGFALTVIGLAIPALSYKLANPIFVYVGLGSLLLYVVSTTIYILYIHIRESNNLSEQITSDRDFTKELKNIIHEYYSDTTKNYNEYIPKKKDLVESYEKKTSHLYEQKKDWWPLYLSGLFFLGLLSILLSFIFR